MDKLSADSVVHQGGDEIKLIGNAPAVRIRYIAGILWLWGRVAGSLVVTVRSVAGSLVVHVGSIAGSFWLWGGVAMSLVVTVSSIAGSLVVDVGSIAGSL